MQKTEKRGGFTAFAKAHGAILIFLLIFLGAAIFIGNFFTVRNVLTVVKQAAVPLVAAMGMMLVLTTGGIDLSLGYTLGLCAGLLGILAKKLGLPAWQAIPLTLLAGAFVGLVNGVIIQYLKVPPFIATLGSGYVLYGVAQIVGKGEAFYQLPEDLLAFGTAKPFAFLAERLPGNDVLTQIFRLPSYLFIAGIVLVLVWLVRHRSTYGRALSAFGFNPATTRLSGVDTARLHVATYALSSTLVALASVLLTVRVNCAQSNLGGANYTFEIVTSAVVGGTSLFGGVSSVINCVFGVLITKTLENGINLMGVNYYLYQPAMGLVILMAIILEVVKNRKL
jgi:ribose transport system permease protein